MSERLVSTILTHLRTEYPGIVEEWHRQRTDNPDWGFPDFETVDGLAWWLDSEVFMTKEFAGGIEGERELGDFCLRALTDLLPDRFNRSI